MNRPYELIADNNHLVTRRLRASGGYFYFNFIEVSEYSIKPGQKVIKEYIGNDIRCLALISPPIFVRDTDTNNTFPAAEVGEGANTAFDADMEDAIAGASADGAASLSDKEGLDPA